MGRRGSHRDDAWKERFRAPQVLTSAVAWSAPDRGIAATNRAGTYQLYRWDVPTGRLTQLTDRPEGIVEALLAPNGRFVYYFDDQQGREIGHYIRVPYDQQEAHAATDSPLAVTDVTPALPPYSRPSSPGALAISRSGNQLALVAAHGDAFHLYAIDVQPDDALQAPRQVWQSTRDALSPVLSSGGEIAVIATDERAGTGHYSLYAFDLASGQQIAELSDGPESSLEPIAFSPVSRDFRLLAVTNRTGIETLLLWDPVSGKRTDLSWPELVGATRAFGWSSDGERIVLRTFEQARQQFFVYEVATRALTRLAHPSGTYRNAYFATTEEIFAHYSDATHPTQLVALDAATGALRRTVLAAGTAPPGHPWRSISFASADGQPIQGWLAVPDHKGPLPAILEAHGGPFTVQTDAFSPSSQTWLDHGYAYLTINYRGSTTFGRSFQEQINGNPGRWEVEDLAAARDWLVREGIADPARILLMGWSYGGYLTLQALGTKPDLWAGGMAGSPITDWRQAYAEASDAQRVGIVAFFGGTPDEQAEQYAASSPICAVGQVRAPVLVIHGRNDSRTPAGPVEAYAKQMQAAGKQIEVHWYETGHMGPLLQVEESIRHQERMLAFAAQVCQRATHGDSRHGLLGALLQRVGRGRRPGQAG